MAGEKHEGLAEKIDAGLGDDESLPIAAKEALIAAFCHVRPPEIPEVEHRIDYIRVFDGGRKGGVSIKPGNVTLNWRKLIGSLPGIVLTGAGATTSPWLIVLGALVIWKDLYSTSRVDLGPLHATAMLTMWNNHDGRNRISEEEARELTNEALEKFDLNQTSPATFASIINDLSLTGCVELSDGEIWLREWIRRGWP